MSGRTGKKDGPDLSRRSFLQGSTLATAGIGMISAATGFAAEAEVLDQGPSVTGPSAFPVTMKINGISRLIEIEPRMTLAEVLRDRLALTGTKVACNRGACSACTVWLDHKPALSCMTLAIEIGNRDVTTIEGLTKADGTLHPVQEAFIAHDALQCGFCTPGMVMSCAALLEQRPDAGVDDIRQAISGHLCRCGTYPHVIAATLAAARARKA